MSFSTLADGNMNYSQLCVSFRNYLFSYFWLILSLALGCFLTYICCSVFRTFCIFSQLFLYLDLSSLVLCSVNSSCYDFPRSHLHFLYSLNFLGSTWLPPLHNSVTPKNKLEKLHSTPVSPPLSQWSLLNATWYLMSKTWYFMYFAWIFSCFGVRG